MLTRLTVHGQVSTGIYSSFYKVLDPPICTNLISIIVAIKYTFFISLYTFSIQKKHKKRKVRMERAKITHKNYAKIINTRRLVLACHALATKIRDDSTCFNLSFLFWSAYPGPGPGPTNWLIPDMSCLAFHVPLTLILWTRSRGPTESRAKGIICWHFEA